MYINPAHAENEIKLEEFLTKEFFFPYQIEWGITNKCNLKCKYCTPSTLPSRSIYSLDGHSKIVAKIIKLRPKILLIGGGEPALVPHLPDILDTIKKNINVYIVLTTNLTREKVILSALKNIGALNVSLDTTDEVKSKYYRGVSPKKILNSLRNINKIIEENGYFTSISVNSVITKDNIEDITQLNQVLYNINPGISHGLSPLQPLNHSLSITNDQDAKQRFLIMFRKLKSRSRNVSCSFVNQSNKNLTTKVICYKRFFRVDMLSDGSCYSPCSLADIKNPVCDTPCSCAEYINLLIKAKSKENIYRTPFVKKFNEPEVAKLRNFVLRYINPELPDDIYEWLYAPLPANQKLETQFEEVEKNREIPNFKLVWLLDPRYLLLRLKTIESTSDLINRIRNVFVFCWKILIEEVEKNRKIPNFKPVWLLNPGYLLLRLKTIKSVSDLIKRVLNVFVLIWKILTGKYEYPLK